MRVIDLSHPLTHDMQVYPGDPAVKIGRALDYASHGVAVSAVELGSHAGTHLDAPSHTIPGARNLSQIQLTELTGPAHLLSLRQLSCGQKITWDQIAVQVPEQVPAIVLISTGWECFFGTPRYLEHPVLALDAVRELARRGMHLLGVDTLSPDATIQTAGQENFAVHDFLLGSDRLIVENLRGLDQLPERCTVGFFPLPLSKSDGAPVRAVAWLNQDD